MHVHTFDVSVYLGPFTVLIVTPLVGVVVLVVTVTVDDTELDCVVLVSVEGVTCVVLIVGVAVNLGSVATKPFPFSCFLPFTISASLGLPSSLTVGGGGGGGGATESVDVGRGGKFTGAKSSFG